MQDVTNPAAVDVAGKMEVSLEFFRLNQGGKARSTRNSAMNVVSDRPDVLLWMDCMSALADSNARTTETLALGRIWNKTSLVSLLR